MEIESQKITHPQMGSQAFSNKAGGVKGSNPYFDLKECSAKTQGKTLKQLKATWNCSEIKYSSFLRKEMHNKLNIQQNLGS